MPADRRRPDVDVAHCASQAGLAAALPPHHAVEPPVNAQPGATVSLAVVSRAASRTETTVEWMTCILTDPRFMHCAARFRGTRIPVSVVLGNLKNLDLPTGELIVVTGVSGSGKSSLVFDTLYAEGQRRYVETFSPYARQFLDRMDRPQVDRIEGVPPAIAIDQTHPVRTGAWPGTARPESPATSTPPRTGRRAAAARAIAGRRSAPSCPRHRCSGTSRTPLVA